MTAPDPLIASIQKQKGASIMRVGSEKFYKRDFWIGENLKYAEPHFRLEKSARIVNRIAQGRECDLLDVGCGPATLMRLLHENIHYYGIDLAIHNSAPNLIETDFLANPIQFGDRQFDIILAQGVFEYVGSFQSQKFSEIKGLLNADGTFIVSYVNFDHLNRALYKPYNNVQSFDDFRKSLERFFCIDRVLPTSHHWHHHEPNRRFVKRIHMHINMNIPFITPLFAVEYFFICSHGVGS
jgi:SAM-dependent methyltransferase